MEGGGEIERDDEVPPVDRERLDRRDMLDARIVDEDVHAAERVGGLAHHRLDLVDLGEIVGRDDRFRAARLLQRDTLALDGGGVAEAVDDEVGALARQRPGVGEADAGGRAGDERGLALQEHGLLR